MLLFLGCVLYFMPSIVARKKRDFGSILLLNLLLGWTVIGWLLIFSYALKDDPPLKSPPLARTPEKTIRGEICPGLQYEARFVSYTPRPVDPEIKEWVSRHPEVDRWFVSKVAGISHNNSDGTSRQEIIRRL